MAVSVCVFLANVRLDGRAHGCESSLRPALTRLPLAPADWQIATLVLLAAGAAATLLAVLVAVLSLCRGTQKRHYRTVAVFLMAAGTTLSLPSAVGPDGTSAFCSFLPAAELSLTR